MPSPWPGTDPAAKAPAAGLYVVATPIGNLEDITLRALRTLSGVALIAAEDTRHTSRLLSHFGIRTPLISCHEHNERQRTTELIGKIRDGAAVALVSDAGTPSVSDPGYRLVSAALEAHIDVIPIPGVSAAITALSASGLATDSFVFAGFAPKGSGRRKTLLQSLADEPRTLLFYESPHRILAFLDDLQHVLGDRPAVLARELTKVHEEFIRGPLSHIRSVLAARATVKGECTLLVGGKSVTDDPAPTGLDAALREALAEPGARLSAVVRQVAARLGLPRKQVYAAALALQGRPDDA